jgi:F-type H+-transporting ATPase subunit a
VAAALLSAPQLVANACPKYTKGSGYCAPSVDDFLYHRVASWNIAGIEFYIDKLTILLWIGIVVVIAGFLYAMRKPSIVPTKRQWVAEEIYGFVRNGVAGDVIGEENAARFGPYLASLFCFVLILNLWEIIPIAQVPVTGKIAIPAFLAGISWVMFNYLGIKQHGFKKYFATMLFPPGVPKWIYILLTPIEFFSTLVVRPFTLAVRLFANMFAGHLLLLVFTTGAIYLFNVGGVSYVFGTVSGLMTILITFFELLVDLLQAYIFVILTSIYIQGALAEEH